MPDYFPFHALNLTRNPFGSLTHNEWMDIAILPPALTRLGDGHIQILGDKGHGKTSLLLGLMASKDTPNTAYERIPSGEKTFTTDLDSLECFFLDEAQRLRRWRRVWRAVHRHNLRLIIGSHRDHARPFARHGLTITTVYAADTHALPHIAAMLSRRIAAFARDETQAYPTLTDDAVAWLMTTFNHDLRAMEFFLYEVFQRIKTPEPLSADSLNAYFANRL